MADGIAVDVIEAGVGPVVILLHSSVSGARQWRPLMADLEGRFHLIAVNMIGYGRNPPWTGDRPQTLDDQADLVEAALPDGFAKISFVGHSMGAAVAMKTAARLPGRVDKLVLIEPNPFYVLRKYGRDGAFAECAELRDLVKLHGASGDWPIAAERFADYWGGGGVWAAMDEARRGRFTESFKANFHEWDAVMNETTPLDEWARVLPRRTLVVSGRQTPRPTAEIVELMREACPDWRYEQIEEGGHMVPLTRPDLVNPIIASFLEGGS